MLNRLKFWYFPAALVAAFVLAALACGGGEKVQIQRPACAGEERTLEITTEALTAEDVLRKEPGVTKTATVRWGFMFEESGGLLENFGKPTGDGVELAVKEINEAGGFQVGDTIYTIELVKRDTRSDVQNTIAVATELVRDEKVNVIWGPATVGEPQITPTTQRAMVLHFCPCQERETTALSSVEKAQGEPHSAFQT